jgi:hypothetical protein
MTTTYQDILGAHDVEIPAHLVAEAEVPVLTGLQFQGDVAIIPTRPGKTAAKAVPPTGVPVVRGEAGGNTHLLVADGLVLWNPAQAGGLALGLVVVPDGAVAYLLHPEHGAMGMAPGHYTLRRQREQADEIRTVQD